MKPLVRNLLLGVGSLWLVAVQPAPAQDDPFGDDFSAGFGTADVGPTAEPSFYVSHRLFSGGQLNLAHRAPAAQSTDHRGLSSLTTGWQPRLEWRPTEGFSAVLDARLQQDWIFTLRPDAGWQDPYRDERETRLDVEEAALRFQTLEWAASVGRQTLAWGFNDVLSVLEPVNPPQRSQPGLPDPDTAFRPRWLGELRYYLGDWTLQGVAALDNPVAGQPVFGSDYYPGSAPVREKAPESPFENPDALSGGLRLSGLARGADLGAFVWRGSNSRGHVVLGEHRYERLTQAGIGASYPVGDTLLKAELRWENGLVYAPGEDTDRLAWTLGADIRLPAASRLVAEHQTLYLPAYGAAMATTRGKEVETRWALSLEQNRWNDRLTLRARVLGFENDLDGGQIIRAAADWSFSDAWQTEAGWVGYTDGDAALPALARNNDRLYWRVDYRF